ncbi:hypothetical protein ACFO3J_22835 [Streptomyces polygonati]|uniref:Uncharacterized protein n=1 Tax=Streptomyces polygonati TaxID=1617087 RepID=A0ABV8HQK3_9ACTN
MLRTRRRAVLCATTVIMSTGLAVAIAPTAFADGSPTTTVTRVVTGDDGKLEVDLSDNTPLTSLQISVRSSTADDASTLLTVNDFSNDTTTAPVQLPAGTAYDSYPVDVDYTLADGTTEHWSGAAHGADGLLNYRKHIFVSDVSTDRATTDFDHRTVYILGQVKEFDPATSSTISAGAGADVVVNWAEQHDPSDWVNRSTHVTTDESGAFQLPVTPGGILQDGTAGIGSTPLDTTAVATPHSVPSVPAYTTSYRITSAPSSVQPHKGTKITVKGKVERLVNNVWKPFGGAPVVTTTTDPDWYTYTVPHQLATTTAAADGSFSYAITANATTTLHTYLKPSSYLPPVTQDLDTINVPTATSITLAAYSINEDAEVTTTGRLTGNCAYQSLWLQYSPNGKTSWLNISHLTTSYANGGNYCSFAMKGGGGYDGYYRVIHAESPQLLGYAQPARRLNRIRTQMSGSVTPTRPAYATTKLTASGTVIQLTSKGWVHYNHAYVVLVYKPKGDPQWYWVKKGYTNAAGRYSFSTPAYGDGTWAAYLATDSKHFYSETPNYVSVNVVH